MSNVKSNKIILPIFILLFVCTTVFAFFVPSSAKAVENVQTSFTSNTYLNTIYTYRESDPTNISNVWFYSTWYIDFVVGSNGLEIFYYSLDTNLTEVVGSDVQYVRNSLIIRPYSDTSTHESWFLYSVNNASYRRVFDYVCQYEYNGSATVLPTYVTVTYTSLSSVIWNFTARRVDNDEQCPIVCQYTWGNDSYKVTLSFVVRTTRDFYNQVQSSPYSYTMYYDANNLQGGNVWQDGFNAGVLKGEQQANSTINENSASWQDGYSKGLDSTFSFASIISGASDALSVNIFGSFSIMDLVTTVFAIAIFVIFLKMFAGG